MGPGLVCSTIPLPPSPSHSAFDPLFRTDMKETQPPEPPPLPFVCLTASSARLRTGSAAPRSSSPPPLTSSSVPTASPGPSCFLAVVSDFCRATSQSLKGREGTESPSSIPTIINRKTTERSYHPSITR